MSFASSPVSQVVIFHFQTKPPHISWYFKFMFKIVLTVLSSIPVSLNAIPNPELSLKSSLTS